MLSTSLARATGDLAEGLLGNPAAFGAAAKFTAAAAAMFAVSGLAAGSAFGGGGGAYGGLSAQSFETSRRVEDSRGSATVIIEGGVLDMSDPRQADAFARALEELSGRRVTVVGG